MSFKVGDKVIGYDDERRPIGGVITEVRDHTPLGRNVEYCAIKLFPEFATHTRRSDGVLYTEVERLITFDESLFSAIVVIWKEILGLMEQTQHFVDTMVELIQEKACEIAEQDLDDNRVVDNPNEIRLDAQLPRLLVHPDCTEYDGCKEDAKVDGIRLDCSECQEYIPFDSGKKGITCGYDSSLCAQSCEDCSKSLDRVEPQCKSPLCQYHVGFECGECPGFHGECKDFVPARILSEGL